MQMKRNAIPAPGWTRPARLLQLITFLILLSVSAAAQETADGVRSPHSQGACAPFAGAQVSQESVKLGTVVVSIPVTVTDRIGRAIDGLKKEDFKVYDDRIEQAISFFSDEDAPASIGILFDVSGSMTDGKIEQAREALAGFIRTSHTDDEF